MYFDTEPKSSKSDFFNYESEYDEVKKCSWNIQQEGKDELDKENLIYLLQHVAGELMP